MIWFGATPNIFHYKFAMSIKIFIMSQKILFLFSFCTQWTVNGQVGVSFSSISCLTLAHIKFVNVFANIHIYIFIFMNRWIIIVNFLQMKVITFQPNTWHLIFCPNQNRIDNFNLPLSIHTFVVCIISNHLFINQIKWNIFVRWKTIHLNLKCAMFHF